MALARLVLSITGDWLVRVMDDRSESVVWCTVRAIFGRNAEISETTILDNIRDSGNFC